MPDRLGRTPFVGRQRELASLLAALDATGHGQGRVALIAGEPGIGKTRLLSEFAQQARAEGWQVFAGRAYDSDGMPAYLPFSEALRDYVRALPLDHLRAQLDEAGPELALLAPDIRRRLPDLATPPPASPEEQRYRLFESVADFLLAVPRFAEARGLLLILDDLHWADPSTLLLMQHLVRRLTAGPLLLAGAYRGQEVGRDHPLAAVLADLRREEAVERIALAPLGAAEIGTLVRGLTGDEAAPVVVEAIERRTEGNPFFVGELVRELVAQEHDLGRPETVVAWPALPEGVREVIDRRLARLSGAAGRLLQVAAVLGSSFSATALRAAAGEEPAILLAALDEALAAGMVRESGDGYEFSHALIRQTLHDGLSLVRRQQLHLQVAEALEQQYAGWLGEYAAELAEHFSQSTEAAGLAKAVAYTEVAAQRASSVYAYGEAVRHREQALQWQVVLDPDDTARRCDLLLALGFALLPAGQQHRALDAVAPEALRLAEGLGDRQRASRTCRLARGAFGLAGGTGMTAPAYRQWAERADRYADPDSLDRVYADIGLYWIQMLAGRLEEARATSARALALARSLSDPQALFNAAAVHLDIWAIGLPSWPRDEWLRLAEEFVARPRERETAPGHIREVATRVFLAAGERGRLEGIWREQEEVARHTPAPIALLWSVGAAVDRALLDGDLAASVASADQIRRLGDELGMPVWGRQMSAQRGFRPRLSLGRTEEVLRVLPEAQQMAGVEAESGMIAQTGRAATALALANLGRAEDARALRELLTDELALQGDVPRAPTWILTLMLETALLLADRELAALLAAQLAPAAADAFGYMTAISVARVLGAAAALLGEGEQAMRYYEQALEVAGKLRFRPELALIHLGIAELLLDEAISRQPSAVSDGRAGAMNRAPTDEGTDSVGRGLAPRRPAPRPSARAGETPALPERPASATAYSLLPTASERSEGMRHLDIATSELREMHMQPALERALQLLDRAKAPVAAPPRVPVYPDGLSRREVEVLRLLAAGRSNQAIADELVLSLYTVWRHVSNLYAKTGAANRAEAASYAHRHGRA